MCGLINNENRIAKKYQHKQLKVLNILNQKLILFPINIKMMQQKKSIVCYKSIIERCLVVKKWFGELGLCLSARNINKYTTTQYEAPMNIEALCGRITG